jgi:ferredoxin
MEPTTCYSVAIANTQERYACRNDQTLLGGMEQLGRKGIPVGCRGGGCGICKVRIEAGRIRCDRMSRSHVTAEEQAQGYVLACRAYPQSDLQLQAVACMARCIERHFTISRSPT